MDRQDASREPAARNYRMNSPDRSRIDPHPRVLDDLIDADHKARRVWELVQTLDFSPLLDRIKALVHRPGRPPTDPRILAALWVYATDAGIGSARELAARCRDCDPYKWICGGVEVNYHTLSDFRVDNLEWLKQQVVANVAALRAEDLVHLENTAQDGMRVRASAGNDSFKTAEKLAKLLEDAEQQWDRLQETFAGESSHSPGQQAAQERAARERLERLKQVQEEVKKIAEQREQRKKGDGKTARASTTDPEARRMKMPDGGTRPAYNVQFVSDLDSLIIVSGDVTNAGSDAGQMAPNIEKTAAEQGPFPEGAEHFADGGFATLKDIESLGQQGMVVFTPVKEEKQQQAKGKDPFAPKPGDAPEVAGWRQRMGTAEAKAKYKQRGKHEWINAESRNRGLQQFLVRGLAKVKAVVLWYTLTHNLIRGAALRAARG